MRQLDSSVGLIQASLQQSPALNITFSIGESQLCATVIDNDRDQARADCRYMSQQYLAQRSVVSGCACAINKAVHDVDKIKQTNELAADGCQIAAFVTH